MNLSLWLVSCACCSGKVHEQRADTLNIQIQIIISSLFSFQVLRNSLISFMRLQNCSARTTTTKTHWEQQHSNKIHTIFCFLSSTWIHSHTKYTATCESLLAGCCFIFAHYSSIWNLKRVKTHNECVVFFSTSLLYYLTQALKFKCINCLHGWNRILCGWIKKKP